MTDGLLEQLRQPNPALAGDWPGLEALILDELVAATSPAERETLLEIYAAVAENVARQTGIPARQAVAGSGGLGDLGRQAWRGIAIRLSRAAVPAADGMPVRSPRTWLRALAAGRRSRRGMLPRP